MHPIHDQKDANKFREGGIFYPTGHVVAAFDNARIADSALKALREAGFSEDHLTVIDAATMKREAGENLEDRGILSVGASVPVREKQLELAEAGCHFLMIYAPEDEDHERVKQSLVRVPTRYAVKYRALVIENLAVDMPTQDSEPARVP